jgi:hypothetical protein
MNAVRASFLIAAVSAALLTACATTPPADETYDGLVPIQAKGFKNAWVKPDMDLSGYNRLKLAPVEFQFRAVRPAGAGRRTSGSEFPVSPENRERLQKVVTEAFQEELARSRRFTLTDETGPDVLELRTSLLDIVSRVPPEPVGRSDIYLDEVGEATLVVELLDSQNGEILARAADRRAAETFGGGLSSGGSLANRVDSVTAWNEVRQLADRWARVLTRRLDQLRTRSDMPGTSPTDPLR